MNRIVIASLSALMLLASCGRQHKAEATVKDFISINANADYDIQHIGSLDSTTYVTDSMMNVMHKAAEANGNWKKGIKYASYKQNNRRPLYFLRVNYIINKDTLSGTFYMPSELDKVAGFI